MTDEQIIEAFEKCQVKPRKKCPGCYQDGPGFGFACINSLREDVLGLMKRQKTQIESLQARIESLTAQLDDKMMRS